MASIWFWLCHIWTYTAVVLFFALRALKLRTSFCTQSYTNKFWVKIVLKKFKTFRYLKSKLEANKTTKGNVFIIDLFKIFMGLRLFAPCNQYKNSMQLHIRFLTFAFSFKITFLLFQITWDSDFN